MKDEERSPGQIVGAVCSCNGRCRPPALGPAKAAVPRNPEERFRSTHKAYAHGGVPQCPSIYQPLSLAIVAVVRTIVAEMPIFWS